jgi:NitT/TauT family transport system permease protein
MMQVPRSGGVLAAVGACHSRGISFAALLPAASLQNFVFVRVPSAATQIFSGLNVGLVLALTGAIVAEFVGAQSGLGVLLLQAGSNLDTATLFAVLVILTVIGLVASLALMALERRVVYWVDRRNGE